MIFVMLDHGPHVQFADDVLSRLVCREYDSGAAPEMPSDEVHTHSSSHRILMLYAGLLSCSCSPPFVCCEQRLDQTSQVKTKHVNY